MIRTIWWFMAAFTVTAIAVCLASVLSGCRVTVPDARQPLQAPGADCVRFCAPARALYDDGRGCSCDAVVSSQAAR